MGEKAGTPEGVSVAMVDAADLGSLSTFGASARPPRSVAPVSSAPPSPQVLPLLEQPQQTAPGKAAPRPNDQRAPELVEPNEAAAQADKQGKETKEQAQESVAWPIDVKALEQEFSADRPAAAKQRDAAAPAKQPAKPQEHQVAKASPPLQLSLPDTALDGLSSSFSRPPGITRSGENDEFGRGVIRALRKTMPDMGSTRGRVTVRFTLSQDGNLVEAVMFAVQQSSFPFPPPNAPPVDRTFLVTYIYEAG
jgi:periplasmic protein TonB